MCRFRWINPPTQADTKLVSQKPVFDFVAVHMTVAHTMLQTEIKFGISNDTDAPRELLFQLPNNDDSITVTSLTYESEGRITRGVIESVDDAMNVYDDALAQNQTAALLTQGDTGLIETRLGNLGVGRSCSVTVGFLSPLVRKRDEYFAVLRGDMFPPRYNADSGALIPYPTGFTLRVTAPLTLLRPDLITTGTFTVNSTDTTHTLLWDDFEATFRRSTDFSIPVQTLPNDTVIGTAQVDPQGNAKAFVAAIQPTALLAPQNAVPLEFIFVLDRSGSMKRESRMTRAVEAVELFLKSLDESVTFNIFGFGSTIDPLFPSSRPYTPETLEAAQKHLADTRANLGATKLLPLLEALFGSEGARAVGAAGPGRVRPPRGAPPPPLPAADVRRGGRRPAGYTVPTGRGARAAEPPAVAAPVDRHPMFVDGEGAARVLSRPQVFVLTDGIVEQFDECVRCIKRASRHARFFSIGVGAGASVEQVRGMANAGKGTYELAAGVGERLQPKIQKMLNQANLPSANDLKVEWLGVPANTIDSTTDSKAHFGIATGWQFYGLVKASVALPWRGISAKVTGTTPSGGAFEIEVPITQTTTETYVQKVAAKEFCSVLASNCHDPANPDPSTVTKIVALSKSHGVFTKYTSFVLVDEDAENAQATNAMQRDNTSVTQPAPRQSQVRPILHWFARPGRVPAYAGARRRADWKGAERQHLALAAAAPMAMMESSVCGVSKSMSRSANLPRSCAKPEQECRQKDLKKKKSDNYCEDDAEGREEEEAAYSGPAPSAACGAARADGGSTDLTAQLKEIVRLQAADGHWPAAARLPFTNKLGSTTIATAAQQLGWTPDVFTTVLYAFALSKQFAEFEDEWDLLYRKAVKFLKANGIPDLPAAMKQVQQYL